MFSVASLTLNVRYVQTVFAELTLSNSSHCDSVCPSVRHTGGSVKNGAS